MKTAQAEIEYDRETSPSHAKSPVAANPRIVLEELFNLLEDYGPAWYTEAHRSRALAALFPPASSVSRRFR